MGPAYIFSHAFLMLLSSLLKSQMPFSKKHPHNHHHSQFESLFPRLAWFRSFQGTSGSKDTC